MVSFEDGQRGLLVAELFGQPGDLVLEDVGEALDEYRAAGCSP